MPVDLIAKVPLPKRTDSRLLVLEGKGTLQDLRFTDLPDLLLPGDLLVLNNTRVIPARLFGQKVTGGKVECLIERVLDEKRALVHLRSSKAPKPGVIIEMDGGHPFRVLGREGAFFLLELESSGCIFDVIEQVGHMPLPPYMDREDVLSDRERYQTVFAKDPGAVAAPTAGLHFDAVLLETLKARGIATASVTLHVGSGTFLPLREEDLDLHIMHKERFTVGPETIHEIQCARARRGRIVAVGTTVVRALESAGWDGELLATSGETNLFIRPGYRFKVVDALLTNFHLPESTLLTLVCAFGGYAEVMAAYRHAVDHEYRFFSYGDAMFLNRQDGVCHAD